VKSPTLAASAYQADAAPEEWIAEECWCCGEWFSTPFVEPEYDPEGDFTYVSHQVYCSACIESGAAR
jgi:hypothetical protein